MLSAREAMRQQWSTLVERLAQVDAHRGRLALLRFYETLKRLEWRFFEYAVASLHLQTYNIDRSDVAPLSDFQLYLVDKCEALHQHIYATLAALALTLNHLRDKSREAYPITSVSKFLDALEERDLRYDSARLDDLNVLRRSVDFRSKYVDHPEKHRLHDWYTHSVEGKYHVVYFQPRREQTQSPEWTEAGWGSDPSKPDFHPPLPCESYYASPDAERTYDAIQRVVTAVLGLRPVKHLPTVPPLWPYPRHVPADSAAEGEPHPGGQPADNV